jgi:DNA polymerase-4
MIIHVDMDAFYASVEERDCPELRGQPVIVGGTPEGRGVVAAANYEARKFGVHSAMPAAKARRLCPHAVFLPSRIDYYARVSRQIHDIFHRFTPLVEPLSLDEAFLDATGSESLFGTSIEIGRQIKQEIRDNLDLVASVGVAPNKFLAKMASDLEKPDGFVVVDAAGIQAFLDPLPVGRLWGVGRVAGKTFERLGIRTIGDMRGLPLEVLQQNFGEHGSHLWELSRGIDQRPVVPDREAKSISHETTFARDIDDAGALRAWAGELTEQVARRLRRHHLRGRTVQLKIRFSDFQTITRSVALPQPTDVTQEIWQAADQMLSHRLPAKHLPIRLLGVGVTGFDNTEETQQMLFDRQEHVVQTRLDQTADQIRERFGDSSLTRASGLLHHAKHTPQPKPANGRGSDNQPE